MNLNLKYLGIRPNLYDMNTKIRTISDMMYYVILILNIYTVNQKNKIG